VENPEVSQAFYDELTGQPDRYSIQSEKPFSLFVSILVPDLPFVKTDISARITRRGDPSFLVLLDGRTHAWEVYYEKHAGDSYLTGPSFQAKDSSSSFHPKGVQVEAGEYEILVSSPGNMGKYILVVGEKEEFPLQEIVHTVLEVPKIKNYFNKSTWSAFSTPTMIGFLGITVCFIAVFLGIVIWGGRKMYHVIKRSRVR
tara:strand:- start:269 stop:868 length:600 start_codon:yes stop_codon:yes gene_type:complete